MTTIDESVKVSEFISLVSDWKLDKREQGMVKKLKQLHEKEMKKRIQEARALERQRVKEEKLEQKKIKEEERKRKLNEKRELTEKQKRLKTDRGHHGNLVNGTIKMMNGEFGEHLPVLKTPRGTYLSKTYDWLPENFHSKLGSCKFSLPVHLDEESPIFYFQKTRDLYKPNTFVTVKGDFDRSQYYCSVVVHGLILMFAIIQKRKRAIFVVDRTLDKVLFENDLLLANYIQNQSMIKVFGPR